MTKPQFKKYITKLVESIKHLLKLEEWTIDVQFEKESIDDTEDEALPADIEIDNKYLSAVVTIYDQLFKEYSEFGKEHLEKTLKHELTHVLTSPMDEFARHNLSRKDYKHFDTLEETAVERISKLL